MNVITTAHLTVNDPKITDWYRTHRGMIAHPPTHHDAPTTYTRHTIKEPPKCPPRQAHCTCGAILIVEDNEDDDTGTISAFARKHLDGE